MITPSEIHAALDHIAEREMAASPDLLPAIQAQLRTQSRKRPFHVVRVMVLVALLTLVATAVAYVVYRLPDVYESSTLIVVKPSTLPQSMTPTVNEDTLTRQLSSINQVVTSRSSLEPLVDKYQLYQRERQRGDRNKRRKPDGKTRAGVQRLEKTQDEPH